jgi:hypothetical protein
MTPSGRSSLPRSTARIDHYTATFTALGEKALNPEDSLALIAERASEFAHQLETA